ncbi:MAG: hypothetical protein JKY99_07930, partial [Rhizobiales bacterium]|nr:hypothetical protein [Hyphomicrobiales bacterium]
MATQSKAAAQINQINQAATPSYSPLMFLSALGGGGLAVTFFLYLMFWVPHKGRPVPVFEDIASAFTTGGLASQIAIAIAMAGIAFFGFSLFKSLIWNFGQFRKFRTTQEYTNLVAGNGAGQLMAIPLALAMAVNAGFIIGLVFVPGLWSVIEYLFPIAMVTFVIVGAYSFKVFGKLAGNVLSGKFDCAKNNTFAQMLPAFAFSMVAVGLAAPAAMSSNMIVVGIAIVLSTLFAMTSIILGLIAFVLGMRSVLENGLAKDAAPTLMIGVPMLTVLGILWLRQSHGMHIHFDAHSGAGDTFLFLTGMITAQTLLLMAGFAAVRHTKYAANYIYGSMKSAGAYALICPLVESEKIGKYTTVMMMTAKTLGLMTSAVASA